MNHEFIRVWCLQINGLFIYAYGYAWYRSKKEIKSEFNGNF